MYGHQVLNQFEQTSYFITKSWFYTNKPDSTDETTTINYDLSGEELSEENMSDQDRMRKFIMDELNGSKKRHFLGHSAKSQNALIRKQSSLAKSTEVPVSIWQTSI